MEKNISKSVIRRLPRYNRFLEELLREGKEKISSRELSERMRLTASQIRQDLNCFGGFGQQGYGYTVAELRAEIAAILKINNEQRRVILIGAGNLGRAIASHINFEKYAFNLIGIFDRDSSAIGGKIADITVEGTEKLKSFCTENSPEMAILCIPPESAREIVSELITECNIKAFWNYSHYDILGDFPDVVVENVHLSDSLMILSYEMAANSTDQKS